MRIQIKRAFFIVIGGIAVIIGLIAIFIPGIPTTPLLLLGSWLFYKSSKRLHDRLHRSFLGKYIKRYESGEGVTWQSKLWSIVFMLIMINVSVFVVLENLHLRIFVVIMGCIGTICILFAVPTTKTSSGKKILIKKSRKA